MDLLTFFDQALRTGNYSRSMSTVQALLAGAEATKSTAPNNPLGILEAPAEGEETSTTLASYPTPEAGQAALLEAIAKLPTVPAALRAGDDAAAIVAAFAADGWPGADTWAGVLESGFSFDEASKVELVPAATPEPDVTEAPSSSEAEPAPKAASPATDVSADLAKLVADAKAEIRSLLENHVATIKDLIDKL